MYKKVMVPLDGSKLAECVLPHVETIAKGNIVESIVFVRAVEPYILPVTAGDYISPSVWTKIETEQLSAAESYLNALIKKLDYGQVTIQTEVIEGSAAQSLIDYATKTGVDLVVIATHGRSGIGRWVWGSIAERLLHSVTVPVLIVMPPPCHSTKT
ncbi:MAG TPA: universal stress protein [Dehalococcoidia bacterium]|nr:universal stress protein [Dehalococcoidia bacterium]